MDEASRRSALTAPYLNAAHRTRVDLSLLPVDADSAGDEDLECVQTDAVILCGLLRLRLGEHGLERLHVRRLDEDGSHNAVALGIAEGRGLDAARFEELPPQRRVEPVLYVVDLVDSDYLDHLTSSCRLGLWLCTCASQSIMRRPARHRRVTSRVEANGSVGTCAVLTVAQREAPAPLPIHG